MMIDKTRNELNAFNVCYREANYEEDIKRPKKKKKKYPLNKRDHLVTVGQGTSDKQGVGFLSLNSLLAP